MTIHDVPVASRADIAAGWDGIVQTSEPWQVAFAILGLVAMLLWFAAALALMLEWGDRG